LGYGLQLVAAAATEPITLVEARDRLRLTQTRDDHELATVHIPAARRYVEARLGRVIITQTWKVTLDHFPIESGGLCCFTNERLVMAVGCYDGILAIPLGPVLSVSSVKYYDTDNVLQTLDTSKYQLDKTRNPARIAVTYGNIWPITYYGKLAAVEVEVIVGDGSNLQVDPMIRAAVLFQMEHYYRGADGVNETVERLLDLAWDGTRHGPENCDPPRYPCTNLGAP
jgi:hypothetical protein